MLSTKFKSQLKAKAHHLHPVIIIGQQGVTPAVIAETDKALKAHELIKVKINHPEREARKEMAQDLTTATKADLIHTIGNMSLLYRPKPEKKAVVKKSVKKTDVRKRTAKQYKRKG